MASPLFMVPTVLAPNFDTLRPSKKSTNPMIGSAGFNPLSFRRRFKSIGKLRRFSNLQDDGIEDPEDSVQEIRVPNHWLKSSKALEESEWLRITLHKWLDDEYIPEPTNVEISKIAAHSYYKSLMENRTDLGDILLKMAVELESISYQESFHGAFSSANAAVNLILQRILQEQD